jgi:hypothetical protein
MNNRNLLLTVIEVGKSKIKEEAEFISGEGHSLNWPGLPWEGD